MTKNGMKKGSIDSSRLHAPPRGSPAGHISCAICCMHPRAHAPLQYISIHVIKKIRKMRCNKKLKKMHHQKRKRTKQAHVVRFIGGYGAELHIITLFFGGIIRFLFF